MIKYIRNNKKKVLFAIISLLILISVFLIILIVKVNSLDEVSKFNNTILAMIEKTKSLEIEQEYVLIELPDSNNLISKNGKVVKSDGKKYKVLDKGYILMYKDGNYSLKLSNELYCAYKGISDKEITIELYGECENYNIEYKEKEEN